MAKATKAQTLLRVEEVLRLRLDGAELWDVKEYCREQSEKEDSPWYSDKPLSAPQVFRYMAKADKLIAASCKETREQLLETHLAQRRNLYAKAVSAGDIRTALAVKADEAQLLGLYPARAGKVELSGPGGKPIESSNAITVTVQSCLTADDIEFARRLVGMAGRDVPANGGPQPVDPGGSQATERPVG